MPKLQRLAGCAGILLVATLCSACGQARVVRIPKAGVAAAVKQRSKAEDGNTYHIGAPMPGSVVLVPVKAGQAVLITEAMKMETEVQAGIAGTVKAIHVAKGDRVNPGEILIEIAG